MSVARYDASLPAAERKRHGIFYTPTPIVEYLLRATAPRGPVVDLSCGDGAFLLAAARDGHPVYGIDRDPIALAHAETALAGIATAPWQVCLGDGLAPALPVTPDVVLGNPPYLEAKKADPALKAWCRRRFPAIARGGFDIYLCFLQAGLELLPPGGRLGYIIPNKFLVAEYARPLREALLETTTIEEVIDVSDLPAFRDAAVYPIMLVLRNAPPPPGHQIRTGHVTALEQLTTGDFPRGVVPQASWGHGARRTGWLPPVDTTAAALVTRIATDPAAVPLESLLDLRWTVSFHRAGLRDAFIFPAPTGHHPVPLLGGKRFHGNADVRRYRTAWSGWWIDYDEARAREAGNPLPPRALFRSPKLVIAQNARRIVATLDTAGYCCKDTFLVGLPRAGTSLPYLLGVLNSALMSFLYGVLFKATHVGGAYLHYLACYLNTLPIRLTEHSEAITAQVERLLDRTLDAAERRARDAEVDALVEDLYGLSAAERAVVHGAVAYAWGDTAARRGAWDARGHAR